MLFFTIAPRLFSLPVILYFSCLICCGEIITLNDELYQLEIRRSHLGILEDPEGRLTIDEIRNEQYADTFRYLQKDLPMNDRKSSAYWLKFSLKNESSLGNKFLIEIYDHNIHDIKVYVPDGYGNYAEHIAGNTVPFHLRTYNHKNFEFDIPVPPGQTWTIYIRVKSGNDIVLVPVLKSYKRFIGYALGEYIILGIFYGILLMMAVYNLLLFFAIKQRVYLYYVIYVLSICLFSTSQTGLGFQYLWKNHPELNQSLFGIFLYSAIVHALLFTSSFLDLKKQFPILYKTILWIIALRTIIFIAGLFYDPLMFTMSVDSIPLLVAYVLGIIIFYKGNKSAKYFVFAYSLLFTGFFVSVLEQYGLIPSSIFTVYSLNIAIILEVIFLSVSLADKMRTEIKLKEAAQQRIVEELQEKEVLKDKVNKELETKVSERTEELKKANLLLARQAEEITRMNMILDLQNRDLKKDVNEVARARVMRNHVDFNEFTKVYPDDLSCYRFLEELKSSSPFICKKCFSGNSGKGKEMFDRRCTSCGYNESITANTIFHKLKFPIVKAFYLMYLVSNNKNISADEMSGILELRRITCYNFKKKINERIKMKASGKIESWDMLILDPVEEKKSVF